MKRPKVPSLKSREELQSLPVEGLVEIILRQQEILVRFEKILERLENQTPATSETSSKPPSSDILQRSEHAAAESSGKRKAGGQPGHPGKTRKGFGRVDRYEVVRPETCTCGSQEWLASPVQVKYRQVAEFVVAPIEVIEFEQQCCCCASCGTMSWGTLPSFVVGEQSLGARLQTHLVWLGGYGQLSFEKQQEWLAEFGGLEVSLGTLQATTERVADALHDIVSDLGDWVKQTAAVQVDETPWLVKGVKEWLWVVCGVGFCLFHAADTRSRAELEVLLGESFAGVLSSDDFSVYNGYPVAAQQKCLAHLRRHFKKVIKLGYGDNPALGQVFLDLIDEAFRFHRHWRDTKDDRTYRDWAIGFKDRVHHSLETWLPKAGYAAGTLLRSLRDKANQWWYFLDHPEIPPDNNRSERSLRLAVTKRKVSGGSRSWEGFADTAILLSVIQSCRAQGRSVVDFFFHTLTVSSPLQRPSLIPSAAIT
jgi:transposase